jgi:hypothetical protein
MADAQKKSDLTGFIGSWLSCAALMQAAMGPSESHGCMV